VAVAAALELPRATNDAAVPLGEANPVAVVIIGPKGELAVGPWEGALPSASEPVSDLIALEAEIVKRSKAGGEYEQRAAMKWKDHRETREYRDQVGEPRQEVHFAIQRKYFGHFPSGLDPQRKDEDANPSRGQTGRLDVARASMADRVPPLGPLIASTPNAPALPTVKIARLIGGAIAVSLDGKPGVLRTGYRWAIDVPQKYDDGATWIEVRADADGLDVIDLRATAVHHVAWDEVGTLTSALGTPPPELVDVLVAPDLTAQKLVDTLCALRAIRWVNLGEAPAGTANERHAQLRAIRLARRMEMRVQVGTFYVDDHMGDEADAVKTVLSAELPALAACYDARRPHMAKSDGEYIGITFVLGPGSKVAKLKVESDDAPLATCMRDVLVKATFTPVEKRQEVSGTLETESPDGRY
jgi:hypothetical protein